jgi:hypothetical protein
VHFQFPSEKVCRYFNSNYIVDEEPKKNRIRRRHRNRTQKNQIPKDGWADYEGEVSRYEDRFPQDNTSPEREVVPPTESDSVIMENKEDKTEKQACSSKSTSPTKQVWKVKINSTLDSAQFEVPLDPSEVPQND